MSSTKRLLAAISLALFAFACGSEQSPGPTQNEPIEIAPGQGIVDATFITPDLPLESDPKLTAQINSRGVCLVTNNLGVDVTIRYRLSKVIDLNDPANYAKQEHLTDFTQPVPSGAQRFPVETPNLIFESLCSGLYQIDCGREGGGLLAYKYLNSFKNCGPEPTPRPTPKPTPSPTPSPSPTPPPPPPPTCGEAYSSAPQPFTLPNSGEATELAWVNANVHPGPYVRAQKREYNNPGNCVLSPYPGFADVVLVKAGQKYTYYLNVGPGDQLCGFGGKDISHISYFACKL